MPIVLKCDRCDNLAQTEITAWASVIIPEGWSLDAGRAGVLCKLCLTTPSITDLPPMQQGEPRVRLRRHVVEVFVRMRMFLETPRRINEVAPMLSETMPDNAWVKEITGAQVERIIIDWIARGFAVWDREQEAARVRCLGPVPQENL